MWWRRPRCASCPAPSSLASSVGRLRQRSRSGCTIRGRKSRTRTASGHASAGMTASWWQRSHVTASERTPSSRMLPSVMGGPGGEGQFLYLWRTYSAIVRSGEKTKLLKSLAPLPGHVSNHVPRPRAGLQADFGGCPGLAVRRLDAGRCEMIRLAVDPVRRARGLAPEGADFRMPPTCAHGPTLAIRRTELRLPRPRRDLYRAGR